MDVDGNEGLDQATGVSMLSRIIMYYLQFILIDFNMDVSKNKICLDTFILELINMNRTKYNMFQPEVNLSKLGYPMNYVIGCN
jgi:hypothetical protein